MHIFQAISLSIFHALFLLFPFLFQQKKRKWWAQMDSNHRPHAYQACALTTWAMRPFLSSFKIEQYRFKNLWASSSYERCSHRSFSSLERRWSSRTFRYGYLVTTSPQLPDPPSAAPSLRLDYGLRVFPTLMVWRAVCTRPGNVFTAACWSAITSNSDFMQASCSLQSELRWFFGFCFTSLCCFPLFDRHCSTCVAQVIRGMMIWRHPHLPPFCQRQSH